jgi:hypothetical protein
MALSPEDQTEIRLLVLQEVEMLFDTRGFSEARRAIDKRRRELEADRLDHQGKHEEPKVNAEDRS